MPAWLTLTHASSSGTALGFSFPYSLSDPGQNGELEIQVAQRSPHPHTALTGALPDRRFSAHLVVLKSSNAQLPRHVPCFSPLCPGLFPFLN